MPRYRLPCRDDRRERRRADLFRERLIRERRLRRRGMVLKRSPTKKKSTKKKMSLASRIERAAEAEMRRFFAERLRRDYHLSKTATEGVLDTLVQYVRDNARGRTHVTAMMHSATEGLLAFVYVGYVGGRVVVAVDPEDGAAVTVDGGVKYYRLDWACEQARRVVTWDARVDARTFAHVVRMIRPPQGPSRLPR